MSATASAGRDVFQFEVITWNARLPVLAMEWNIVDGPTQRGCRLGAMIEMFLDHSFTPDVLAMQETWDPEFTAALASALEYKAEGALPNRILNQPKASYIGINGGLSLLSRWPLEMAYSVGYRNYHRLSDETLANKGWTYAYIRPDPQHRFGFHLVTTHLDASDKANPFQPATVRDGQVQELRTFLETTLCSSPNREPAIVLGDFNIHHRGAAPVADIAEYVSLQKRLSLSCMQPAIDGYAAAHPSGWKENDANAGTLNLADSNDTLVGTREYPTYASERVDYIWILNPYAKEENTSIEVVSANTNIFADTRCKTEFLSDHKALHASLRLQRNVH